MRLYEITFSPTGGTEKAADMLLQAFPEKYEKISLLECKKAYAEYSFQKGDICIIAVPSYGGRVPATASQRLAQMQGNKAACILLVVYGNRAFEDTLIELKQVAEDAGFVPMAAVAAIAEHSIMRQFAAGRPDAFDKEELLIFGKKIRERLLSETDSIEVQVPGNIPYKELHASSMVPKVLEACVKCGCCVRECPVEAIDPKTFEADKEKCISCMRCIAVCPENARILEKELLAGLVSRLEKACSGHRENQLFL